MECLWSGFDVMHKKSIFIAHNTYFLTLSLWIVQHRIIIFHIEIVSVSSCIDCTLPHEISKFPLNSQTCFTSAYAIMCCWFVALILHILLLMWLNLNWNFCQVVPKKKENIENRMNIQWTVCLLKKSVFVSLEIKISKSPTNFHSGT